MRSSGPAPSTGPLSKINANPYRLDRDWRWHGRALELGCALTLTVNSISPAGSCSWPERVLNSLNLKKVE